MELERSADGRPVPAAAVWRRSRGRAGRQAAEVARMVAEILQARGDFRPVRPLLPGVEPGRLTGREAAARIRRRR